MNLLVPCLQADVGPVQVRPRAICCRWCGPGTSWHGGPCLANSNMVVSSVATVGSPPMKKTLSMETDRKARCICSANSRKWFRFGVRLSGHADRRAAAELVAAHRGSGTCSRSCQRGEAVLFVCR